MIIKGHVKQAVLEGEHTMATRMGSGIGNFNSYGRIVIGEYTIVNVKISKSMDIEKYIDSKEEIEISVFTAVKQKTMMDRFKKLLSRIEEKRIVAIRNSNGEVEIENEEAKAAGGERLAGISAGCGTPLLLALIVSPISNILAFILSEDGSYFFLSVIFFIVSYVIAVILVTRNERKAKKAQKLEFEQCVNAFGKRNSSSKII